MNVVDPSSWSRWNQPTKLLYPGFFFGAAGARKGSLWSPSLMIGISIGIGRPRPKPAPRTGGAGVRRIGGRVGCGGPMLPAPTPGRLKTISSAGFAKPKFQSVPCLLTQSQSTGFPDGHPCRPCPPSRLTSIAFCKKENTENIRE